MTSNNAYNIVFTCNIVFNVSQSTQLMPDLYGEQEFDDKAAARLALT